MDLELSEDQYMLVRLARSFTQQEIAPNLLEMDKREEFPLEIFQKLAELGFFGIIAPPEYGGGGIDVITYTMCLEEFSRVDSSIPTTLQAHCLTTDLYNEYASPEQKEKYLRPLAEGKGIVAFALTEPNAGSDNSRMETRAVKQNGQWVINGQKTFITSAGTPMSHHAVVFASTGTKSDGRKEVSSFIVPNGTPGFEIGQRFKKIGWHTMDTRELFFEDCAVPEEDMLGKQGQGLRQALDSLDLGRIAFGAIGTGVAQGCLDLALDYAKQRVQFGQPIARFQAIHFKLADMATKVEASRQLYRYAAYLRHTEKPHLKEAAMAKLYSSELAVEAAREAAQIFGGYSFIRETPIAHHYCDAKVLEIGEGTSEIQRISIARELGCIDRIG